MKTMITRVYMNEKTLKMLKDLLLTIAENTKDKQTQTKT